MLVHDVQSADKSCLKHDASYQGHEYSGKLSMCSDNKRFWIWYRLIQAVFQAVSSRWKVHPWLILGLRTCICFPSRDVCLLPDSLIPPECLLHTRPGVYTAQTAKKCTIFFYIFFFLCVRSFSVSFVLYFCIIRHSGEKKVRKFNAQRWCCCNDVCKLLLPFHCCCRLIN